VGAKIVDLSRDVQTHVTMAELTNEERRALHLLASSLNGYAEAVLIAHGFELEMLGKLVLDGFAEVEPHTTMTGRQRSKVMWMRITAAGRKAIAE
jgi:hypothetical protein